MKKYLSLLLCITLLQTQLKAQIGISATNSPPNASAMLDVSSTTKGLLPPRMTSAQRTAIPTPADGLIVFDTDTKTLWNRQSGVWVNLLAGGGGSGPWNLSGNSVFVNGNNRVGINTNNPSADLEIQGGGGLLISEPYTVTTSPPTNTYTMPYSGTIATITDNAGRILDPGGNGNFLTNTYYASYVRVYPINGAYGLRFTFESLDAGSSSIIFSTSADVNDRGKYILEIGGYSSSLYPIGRPFVINESQIYIHNLISGGTTPASGFQLLFESLGSVNTSKIYSEKIGEGFSFNKFNSALSTGYGKARGWHSTALGGGTASGYGSIVLGNGYATGGNSVIIGDNCYASGRNSIALGFQANTNNKEYSFAFGGVHYGITRATNDKDYQMTMHFDEFQFLTGTSNYMTIANGQISTSNSLYIGGTTNQTVNGYAYLGNVSPVTGYYGGTAFNPYSIAAASRVLAQEFDAFSDARHKKLRSYSNGKTDLSLLNQLKVSNYTFIDTVDKGTKMQMGFIAQQVETIVPEAVNKIQDYIPSVYDMAKSMVYDANAHTLTISTYKPHDFQVNDEIKLISLDKEHKVKVDKIIDINTFVVNNWEKPVDKIFVFGKRVDDFRTVDYDRLFTLGISSIQELSRRVEQLEKENEILKSERKAFQQMKSDIAELRAMIVK
jgi:hypothetical protein